MHSILGIDTASPRGSVALLVDGTCRGSLLFAPGETSSGLAAGAEAMVRDAGLTLARLDGIAVSRGPGSFTGLRIGLAWAKGVAVAAGVPLALVSAHEAAARAARDEGVLRVSVTPGERKGVEIALWAAFDPAEDGGARPRLLEAPASVPEVDAAEHVVAIVSARPFIALPAQDAIAALLEEDGVPSRPPPPLAIAVAEVGRALIQAGESSDVTTPEPLRIAPLATSHIDEIVALERRCFGDPWTRHMFWTEMVIGGGTYSRGAFLDGVLVGYLFAVLVMDEAHLGNLAVDPVYRRRGIAQRLLEELLGSARRSGVERVTLEVRESNLEARKFYERNGFLDVAIRKSYYRKPTEDAIVMLLMLPGGPTG